MEEQSINQDAASETNIEARANNGCSLDGAKHGEGTKIGIEDC